MIESKLIRTWRQVNSVLIAYGFRALTLGEAIRLFRERGSL